MIFKRILMLLVLPVLLWLCALFFDGYSIVELFAFVCFAYFFCYTFVHSCKPTYIYFVRHGESEANIDWSKHETIQDYKISLTEKGRLQAQEAGRYLKALIGKCKVAFYGSPYLRTRQTKAEIIKAFSPNQIERNREDLRLREQEWGHFRSKVDAEKIADERDYYGTLYYRIPGGESGPDAYDRATGFLSTLHRDFKNFFFPDHVVIVSHGLTIRLLIMRWFHLSPEDFEKMRNPHNCEVFVMKLQSNNKYKLTKPFPLKYEHP